MKKIALIFVLMLVLMVADESASLPDAPGFTLKNADGSEICLDYLLKKGPVLMSFWALWCKMCIKELDALRPYTNGFDSLNITLLAISQDKARSIPQVKPFAKSHKWEYEVLLDPENIMRDLYNVQVMPTFFIIDQNKKIVFTHQGYKPGDEKIIIEKLRELYGQGKKPEE